MRGLTRRLRRGSERKAPSAPQAQLPFPDEGLTRRLRRGRWGCHPEGGSTFFRSERKYQRKHAARRLREKALYCPFWRRGSQCRAQWSWIVFTSSWSALVLAFFRRQNARAFFPESPCRVLSLVLSFASKESTAPSGRQPHRPRRSRRVKPQQREVYAHGRTKGLSSGQTIGAVRTAVRSACCLPELRVANRLRRLYPLDTRFPSFPFGNLRAPKLARKPWNGSSTSAP